LGATLTLDELLSIEHLEFSSPVLATVHMPFLGATIKLSGKLPTELLGLPESDLPAMHIALLGAALHSAKSVSTDNLPWHELVLGQSDGGLSSMEILCRPESDFRGAALQLEDSLLSDDHSLCTWLPC
jgi:hypothetical protein